MNKFLLFTVLFACISCSEKTDKLDEGLVAFYSFCNNANDKSGHDNNATVNGAELVNDRFGNPESAYKFDGESDYMEIANSPSLKNIDKKLSISMWFNTHEYYSNGDKWAVLINKAGESKALNSRQFSLYYKDNGDIFFNSDVIGNYDFKLNTWYHITLTYDLGSVNLYINGEKLQTKPVTEIVKNDLSLFFGYDQPGATEYYNGILDDIRIYNRVLTKKEIEALMSIDDTCEELTAG
ncbi:LamG domain-containing protein [Marixanthomonas spongiae]|uniref:LamG-like jellyroll fold domain-containing protein n=1 Tax=Marixanthomonas spongiae TaxID=2174845 RepID=A0A2U0HW36_9FLAO|nr:LamG domain-containing protein [Marixanthomonas spongiae]PVW13046.1 hypothetical protein DDV96_14080 [Marixanthomonas spongiae]